MGITNSIIEHIADIGLTAITDTIKTKKEIADARRKLVDFIQRQKKYNLNCSLQEEIDFQGVSEYICNNLIDDVRTRLFGKRKDRGLARQLIMNRAAYYAQAKTKLSEQRAKNLVGIAIDILREYYRKKAKPELLLVAAEIEDTIIDELGEKIDSIDKTIQADSLLSLDKSVALASQGHLGEVEQNVATLIKAVGTTHCLSPYYGYRFNGQNQFVSVPLTEEAAKKYPPHFEITPKSFSMGDEVVSSLSPETLNWAYRHQIPITFDIAVARKYLGDVPDPVQHEADELVGHRAILSPPKFPKAVPCNIIIDEEVVVDYLLLRLTEILDDGTVIITNDEQENFSFGVRLAINPAINHLNFSISPSDPTNAEALKYRMIIKKAGSASNISIKILPRNEVFVTSGRLGPVDFDTLDAEIDFLQKVVAIEEFFETQLQIPQEISVADHKNIDYLYPMIKEGAYHGQWDNFVFTLSISDASKKSIADMQDKALALACSYNIEAELFGQTLRFAIIRRIDHAKIEDYEKVKAKLAVLDDGDEIKLKYVPSDDATPATYSDVFYTDDAEREFLGSFAD